MCWICKHQLKTIVGATVLCYIYFEGFTNFFLFYFFFLKKCNNSCVEFTSFSWKLLLEQSCYVTCVLQVSLFFICLFVCLFVFVFQRNVLDSFSVYVYVSLQLLIDKSCLKRNCCKFCSSTNNTNLLMLLVHMQLSIEWRLWASECYAPPVTSHGSVHPVNKKYLSVDLRIMVCSAKQEIERFEIFNVCLKTKKKNCLCWKIQWWMDTWLLAWLIDWLNDQLIVFFFFFFF
jgi:hypothetical protein